MTNEIGKRVLVDMSVATLDELLSAIHDRVVRCQKMGAEIPPITLIAGKVLREARADRSKHFHTIDLSK